MIIAPKTITILEIYKNTLCVFCPDLNIKKGQTYQKIKTTTQHNENFRNTNFFF